MAGWRILLLFFICNICCADELFIRLDSQIFRIGNTHSFDLSELRQKEEKLLVSVSRDLFLESVKYSVKSPIPSNIPSNMSAGQEIKLKNGGNFLTGKIISFDRYFIVSDLKVKRGDSGKTVFDVDNIPVGTVSHYKNNLTFIVRIDNLSKDEFEEISPGDLYADRQVFNEQKEYEYQLIDALKNSSSHDDMKRFLNNNLRLKKEYINWHSKYLKNSYDESVKITSAVLKSFL